MPTGFYKRTKEYRKIMSEIAIKSNYGKWMLGKKQSIETKNKKSESLMGHRYWGLNELSPNHPFKQKGRIPWNKGIEFFAIKGQKNPNWLGGVTKENEKIRKSVQYKLWREAVFARDNWTCQECKIRGNNLEAHHIKPFYFFPELRLAIDNGVTLCVPCHKKTDTWGKKIFNSKYVL